MVMTKSDLRTLLDAATPRPWWIHNDTLAVDRITSKNGDIILATAEDMDGTGFKMPYPYWDESDATLIVAMLNAADDFLALYEAAKPERDYCCENSPDCSEHPCKLAAALDALKPIVEGATMTDRDRIIAAARAEGWGWEARMTDSTPLTAALVDWWMTSHPCKDCPHQDSDCSCAYLTQYLRITELLEGSDHE